MTNLMKDSQCRLCGKDMNSISYQGQMDHIQMHAAQTKKAKDQTTMGDY